MTENEIKIALNELYRRVGTQKGMADLAGITQSTINAYLSGKAKIENMPLGIFLKLFRDIRMDFFGGSTGNVSCDALRSQLLEIFDGLNERDKVRMVTMAAANFGETIRAKTLSDLSDPSDPNRKRNRHD